MSINWQVGKQVCPDNRMLFGHKKEWSTDKCCNMDELQKHYAKSNKSVTKDYIHNTIYMKYPEQASYRYRK